MYSNEQYKANCIHNRQRSNGQWQLEPALQSSRCRNTDSDCCINHDDAVKDKIYCFSSVFQLFSFSRIPLYHFTRHGLLMLLIRGMADFMFF